jgi:hypothetical protein
MGARHAASATITHPTRHLPQPLSFRLASWIVVSWIIVSWIIAMPVRIPSQRPSRHGGGVC